MVRFESLGKGEKPKKVGVENLEKGQKQTLGKRLKIEQLGILTKVVDVFNYKVRQTKISVENKVQSWLRSEPSFKSIKNDKLGLRQES